MPGTRQRYLHLAKPNTIDRVVGLCRWYCFTPKHLRGPPAGRANDEMGIYPLVWLLRCRSGRGCIRFLAFFSKIPHRFLFSLNPTRLLVGCGSTMLYLALQKSHYCSSTRGRSKRHAPAYFIQQVSGCLRITILLR